MLARQHTPLMLRVVAVGAGCFLGTVGTIGMIGMIALTPVAVAIAGTEEGANTMGLSFTSSAFTHQGEIPALYTCEGKDISPPLSWTGLPSGTKSLALVVDDPDAPDPKAPKMTWVHWVLYNIPPGATGLRENLDKLPEGTREGLNNWKRTAYGGPCPPIGRHRYFHKLYALDCVLPDLGKPDKGKLEKAMDGHILAKAELIGTYQKKTLAK